MSRVEELKKLRDELKKVVEAKKLLEEEREEELEATKLALQAQSVEEIQRIGEEIVESNRQTLEALKLLQISVPDIQVPDITIPDISVPEVKIPEISIPEIRIPDISVPEVKIPDIKVPTPKVTVNVPDFPDFPEIPAPIVNMPELMDVRGNVGIINTVDEPIPTRIVDKDGNDVALGGGSVSGGKSFNGRIRYIDTETGDEFIWDGSVMDYKLRHAVDEIKADYGDKVSVREKAKDLLKFGRNDSVPDTQATIMTLPSGVNNETYVQDNLIAVVSSASVADSTTAVIEGHTIDTTTNDLTFVTQEVTMNGQATTSLSTPLARATRLYNSGTANFEGPIYVSEDTEHSGGVPLDTSKVHLVCASGKNQSEKAATAISKDDYYIVTQFYADVLSKVAAVADIELQIRRLDSDGIKVFRNQATISVSESHQGVLKFDPYLVVRKNTDIRLVGKSDSASGRSISGGFQGYLAKVV